jgi:carbonic anhydrase
LRTPLFVVLGHENCGAVHAALDTRDEGTVQLCRIQILVNSILPGLPEFDSQVSPEVRLSRAVEANVRSTLAQISDSPEAKARLAEGRVRLVGAVYDIDTGIVRWLE